MQTRDCVTLADWRRQRLRRTQWQIAAQALCSQTWVWKVENGHLPDACTLTFERLTLAYGLVGQEEQFIRMVQNAARLKALKQHISHDFPLALFASPGAEGRVVALPAGFEVPKAVNQ